MVLTGGGFLSRYPQSDEACEAYFVSWLKHETTLANRTVTFYREEVHAVIQILKEEGLQTLPHHITEDDVRRFLDAMQQRKLAVSTRKGYMSALKKYCTCFNNPAPNQVVYKLPQDTRPKVDWLSLTQAQALLQCKKSWLQEIVIHLELCLGLRRVEVVRMAIGDIHADDQYLTVRGKGPQGGKLRCIPYTHNTHEVLIKTLEARQTLIDKAKRRYPKTTVVPDNLILWLKAGRLHAYSEEGYGIDKAVCNPLSKDLGFGFSNHTLRRTFGRALYRAGVEVATIAKILGHESTEVTLRYIGVDLDDMRAAMKVNLY